MKEVSHTDNSDEKDIYKLIIDKLQKAIRDGKDSEDGFRDLLDLARLREYLSGEKTEDKK
jgi:hypothetical protein